MSDCIFCAIVRGEAPAARVYQDDFCTVFMDLYPMKPGHLLVVPNQHAGHLLELPRSTQAQLFAMAQRLLGAVKASGLPADGFNLLLNDGPAANQTVPHVHLHLVPRSRGDLGRILLGFARRISRRFGRASPYTELERTAAQIRAALSRPGGS